ncbi:uncharacterized protein LOC143627724 [Bidens hawaiensis]|uniref:uncharacterized protein LOC143627724 n=1 Tax=Bidens hawaiensis TaxID=980011 RepID=UPI004049C4B4
MKESPERYTNLKNGKFEKSLEPSDVCAESIEKAKEVYIDKNVTCYEDNNVVKDICVDEGLSHGKIINGDKHDGMIKEDVEDYCKNQCLFDFGPDNPIQNDEEKSDSSADSLNNSVRDLEPGDNGIDGVGQQLSENAGSEANDPKQNDTTIDIPNEIKTEKNTPLNPDTMKPTIASGPELPLNTESALNHHDSASNNLAAVARGGSDSSFSMAGPVSGLVTYSGPITAYGNISHRSDESNASVRSFAFPILPNEWNSSPIRMAKADPKQSRKHRGWRQAFICCGF